MSFRKFKAGRLFDGYKFHDEAVLIANEDGTIESIVPDTEAGGDVEFYNGILTPGLINCHCHLELSHLKNVIPPGTGLIDFLLSVVQKRGFAAEIIQEEIRKGEEEMYRNGIVAVGDICNTTDAIDVKRKSKIRWQSFVEVLSISDENADSNIAHYEKVLREHIEELDSPHRSVLSPHAPYTVSKKSFARINEATGGKIISMHNQEHPAEDELYQTGKSEFLKLLALFGFRQSPFPITGQSSLRSCLPSFNKKQRIFLIHNTYMPEDDIVFAKAYAKEWDISLVYCLCPNANLYIENKLPPAHQFIKHECDIVLGTDSYSSNWQLSIAKEIQTLLATPYFKNMAYTDALSILLKWATSNGARALNWDDEIGSFEKGMKPGVVLIDDQFSSSRRLL